MDSVYENVHATPYQKDQMPYGPYYYPGPEAFPAQMYYANSPRPPVNYGYWPWGNNHGCGYASPAVCHGCCNHTHWPINHAWGSPYPHVPPFHCPGGYSIPPIPYMPQPFYAMEQPRYEYEKNVPRDHHCCGCPNHPSHQEEQKNVRIEEEEPDGERKKNDSVVPFKFKNKSYPVVWLPPDFSKNKEYGKQNNLEDSRDASLEVKPNDNHQTVGQQPVFWKGWHPLDLNELVLSKQMGDGERNHHKKDEGKGNFPFPSLWIAYEPEGKKSEEQHKMNDVSVKTREESVKGSGGERNCNISRENIGGQVAHRARDIPVKKLEQHEEDGSHKDKVQVSDASVNDGIVKAEQNLDNGEKKLLKDGAKRKSPSPPKSSKLPPVCLRVDPLPRKKGANGSSRSPSPPGDKQKVYQLSKEASKVSSDNKKANDIRNSEVNAGKGITKTIDVVDGKAQQGHVNVETPINHLVNSWEGVSRNQTMEKPKEESVSQKHVETDKAAAEGRSENAETAREKNEEKEVRMDEAKGSRKRKLSEEEAAVVIQSAYRGFDVRKWESIKKLKQIAKVWEQIAEVKQLIQAMESSSGVQGDIKQRNIIAETMMSLLLKLDTIQGLHPSIREVRKTVVRELVSLQEKLDSLMNKRSQTSTGQESIMRPAEDVLKETEGVKLLQDGNVTTSDLQERHENHLDRGSGCQSMETEEATLIAGQPIGKSEEPANSCAKGTESASEPNFERVEVLDNVDTSIAKEDHTDLVLDQSPEGSLLLNYIEEATDFASTDHGNSADLVLGQTPEVPFSPYYVEEGTDFASTDHVELESELVELPVGVLDELCSEDSTNERTVDADTSKNGPTKQLEEGVTEAPINSESHNDAPNEENKEQVELNEVVNLPFSGDDVILEANESLNNYKSDFGTEEEVDNNFGGDGLYMPGGCPGQHPENIVCGVSEPHEASGETELPIPRTDSSLMSKETLVTLTEEEIRCQECASEQESSLINEFANADEAAHMVEVKVAAEDKSGGDGTDSCDQHRQSMDAEPQMVEETTIHTHPETEVLSEKTQECNVQLPKDTSAGQIFKDASGEEENVDQDWMKVTSHGRAMNRLETFSDAKDELNQRNRKLIEENERLREMMEKLIESGQEQLTAISSLSGRVKDLEKRLSRKKKLKMKHYRTPRSGSSCVTSTNGSPLLNRGL